MRWGSLIVVLLALVPVATGAPALMAGCTPGDISDGEVKDMQSAGMPQIDTLRPERIRTATFALG